LPNCVYLFIAETAMLNTYPQKSLGTAGLSNRSLCKIAPKKTPTRPFYFGHPRAFSRPMKLSNNITFKAARLYSRPIAVQRRYFAPSAGA
jgi:hypothetical protein